MADLPVGTVTFLFTDIEGSTRLLQQIGDDYPMLLEQHNEIMRSAIAAAGGVTIRTEGDSFFAVFVEAPAAVEAAITAQRALTGHQFAGGVDLKVRMGAHTGVGKRGGDDYVGLDVHRAARIADAGHGGQVLISAATLGLAEPSLPADVVVVDLGDHFLKDLVQSERLYRLQIDGVPDNRAEPRSRPKPRTDLSAGLDSFVGRDAEMEDVQNLLESTRLLTLTGPGGTGKTRLALEVAAGLGERFDDGVSFVPLAGITDHNQVAAKVLEAFPDHMTDAAASIEDQLQAYLAGRSLFLVLDNFEHVIDAAPLVGKILEASPGTRIVVTSRVSLQIAGEQEMPVLPLAVPEVGAAGRGIEATSFDSIDLFVDRARAVRPSFSVDDDMLPTLVELVSKLDGLPLAIELAASRVRTLSPRAILDNLSHVMASGGRRDAPVRQQTMHNTIAWSYDLLPDPGKELLAFMSTFAGGAGFDEIQMVAGSRLGDGLLGAIETLAEHSLIRGKEQGDVLRFHMLETVRQFGLEQLRLEGMLNEAQHLHALAYSRLVTTAEPHLTGRDSGRWLDNLSADHDNIRAALQWAVNTEDLDLAYQMASSLWRFFHMRGLLSSARELLNDLLASPGASPAARAKALEAAGGVAYWSGNMDAAYAYYEEALELVRRTGDPKEIANGLYNLGFARNYAGAADQARELFEEAHKIYAELGDRPGMAATTWGLGDAWTGLGELTRARECFEHSIAEFEQLDDPFSLGWALYTQGEILVRLGEYENARDHLERGLALLDSTDISAIVMFLAAFASLELAGGNRERGIRLAGAMTGLRDETGTDLVRVGISTAIGVAPEALGLLEGDLSEIYEAGRAMSAEAAVAFALHLDD